jgi:uncharacterized membrane protein YbhN (UPF0104 family)
VSVLAGASVATSASPATPGPHRRRGGPLLRVLRPFIWAAAVSVGVTIIVLLPRTTGTTWADIIEILEQVTFSDVVLLTVLWGLGLFAYSFVLSGSLPGLRRRRALTLNLTGSAVANVAPLGGAWGVGLNTLMLRRWGYAGKEIASFMMVSNIWNVLAKLGVSGVVIGFLAMGGVAVPLSTHGAHAVVTSAVLAVVVILAMLASDRVMTAAGWLADVVVNVSLRIVRVSARSHLKVQLPAVRHAMLRVVRSRWPQMSAGMVVYLALQAALLWTCLHILGNQFTGAAVLTAFAVDRLLTAVPLTPGGSGVVEAGTAAALIALGGAPAQVAAAVLLYRSFTFLAEIPVGGAWAIGWFAIQRKVTSGGTAPAGGVG